VGVLEGRVDLVRHVGREETLLGSMDVPGRWAGGSARNSPSMR
jgi:hypothetical protein